jgi:hypothetical protein
MSASKCHNKEEYVKPKRSYFGGRERAAIRTATQTLRGSIVIGTAFRYGMGTEAGDRND